MDNLASILTALSLVIVAITGLYTAVRINAVHTEVGAVKEATATANGIALGLLTERTEGRRVEADIPEADRTPSEQGYVDRLHGPEDAEGDPPPVPK